MVTHTRNLCSAFIPSKVHTHSSEHTPGAVGSHLCCGAWGAVGGSVSCSRTPQSWYWGWRECWIFTPPTYNPCRPETRTHNLWITSPTLTIRPQLPLFFFFFERIPQHRNILSCSKPKLCILSSSLSASQPSPAPVICDLRYTQGKCRFLTRL